MLNRRSFVKGFALLGLGSACTLESSWRQRVHRWLKRSPAHRGDAFIHPLAEVIRRDPITNRVLVASMGHMATVKIDEANGRVVKSYQVDGTCVGGAAPLPQYNTLKSMRHFYQREKEALTRLLAIRSPYIHSDIEFDDRNLTIITPFVGHDLMTENIERLSAEDSQQIVDMYREFVRVGILKQNMSLSQLVRDRSTGRLLAVDFKWWAEPNRDAAREEIKGLLRWISRYDENLPERVATVLAEHVDERILIYDYPYWKEAFERDQRLALLKNKDSRYLLRNMTRDQAERFLDSVRNSALHSEII